MDLVLDRPLAADVAGEMPRRGLARIQAGDDEHRHGGLHLLPDPALAFPHPGSPGDVPFDEGRLAGVGEPPADVVRGGHDLDGAALAAAVAFLLGGVLHGYGGPVQGVQLSP